ncbi:MAG: UDP-3-O-(3-hydroxymyristoyl)glucosamine N-acyltransferase [Planctomycetota bacterium]
MEITLGELARLVGGGVVGDPRTVIRGAAGLDEAGAGDITLLFNPRYASALKSSRASAVVVWPGFNTLSLPMIHVRDPEASFAKIAQYFSSPTETLPKGVHPLATLGAKVHLGPDVAIGPHVTVMDYAEVGEGTVLFPGTYVGFHAKVGDHCILHPGVAVLNRVIVKNRVIIHPGAVLGAEGFGYTTEEGRHRKIPHLGTVVVEDDVEIGANVTIDRARFDRTVIGEGTKIDNLVHVAHNVKIGAHCLLVAQTGVAGSVRVEDEVLLAGQSGVERHVQIGKGARIAGKAGVTHDVPPGATVAGFPAQHRARWLRGEAALRRLPGLLKEIRELTKRVENLENGSDHHRETH